MQLLGLEQTERSHSVTLFEWIHAGAGHTSAGDLARFSIDWGFLLDPLSAVMVLVVTGIGLLIHIYSTGYMAAEDGYYRFFAYLNLFMFSMLMLILGNNYLMLFVGWEGVGLCSYLLIGFFITKKSAGDAAKKAFVVNRIGDWGFSIGIMLIFFMFGTLEFAGVREAIHSGVEAGRYNVGDMAFVGIAIALFIGATGKSAQVPLYVLAAGRDGRPHSRQRADPRRHDGHRGRVHGGAKLLHLPDGAVGHDGSGRCRRRDGHRGGLRSGCFRTTSRGSWPTRRSASWVTWCWPWESAHSTAGIFHLMTHAFFKALLFLGSGSVIHAIHHEQDMRKMGALKDKIPITFMTMAVGTLAIAGTPLLSGFFSKDEILWRTFSNPQGSIVLYVVALAAAGMTAFYMFRMLFMTFFGESRVDPEVEQHIHESPRSMTVPLIILALGAVLAGYIGLPPWLAEVNHFEHFLEPVFEPLPIPAAEVVAHSHALEIAMAALSVGIAFIGFFIAYRMYYKKSDLPDRLAGRYQAAYQTVLNKYYVDELYDLLFVNRAKDTGTRLWQFDAAYVDGAVNGSARATVKSADGSGWWDHWIVDGSVRFIGGFFKTFSWPVRLIQTGYVQNYALVMILGVLIFIGYVLWG